MATENNEWKEGDKELLKLIEMLRDKSEKQAIELAVMKTKWLFMTSMIAIIASGAAQLIVRLVSH